MNFQINGSIKRALKRLVSTGDLEQVKGRGASGFFKIGTGGKAALAEKPKPNATKPNTVSDQQKAPKAKNTKKKKGKKGKVSNKYFQFSYIIFVHCCPRGHNSSASMPFVHFLTMTSNIFLE